MINLSRQVDVLLFTLEEDISFGDAKLEAGWNQIRRINNVYEVFRLNDLTNSYTYLHLDEMPNLLRVVLKRLVNEGFYEDDDIIAPVHTHPKLTLLKKVANG